MLFYIFFHWIIKEAVLAKPKNKETKIQEK